MAISVLSLRPSVQSLCLDLLSVQLIR